MAPLWVRTGYRFFPFAAEVGDVWWVLRFNVGFPEHDLFTVFVGNRAAADVTGDPKSVVPLIASIGSLSPVSSQGAGCVQQSGVRVGPDQRYRRVVAD